MEHTMIDMARAISKPPAQERITLQIEQNLSNKKMHVGTMTYQQNYQISCTQ